MKIGFIDYYLDEWHANNYPRMIAEASAGQLEVTHAYALIDSPRGGLTTDEWCSKMGIARCETMEEIIETCDGLIVLSPDNCEMHEQLCQLPLRSGKPTYVDKTFAPDGATARRIFDIANEYGTPCYSSSALRFADEYQPLLASRVSAINAWGPNDYEIYAIHQLEPIMMLMRAEPKRVMATGTPGYTQLLIEFANGGVASLCTFAAGAPFAMNVVTDAGNKIINVESDFFMRFIEAMVTFFKTKEPQVPQLDTVRIMDVRGAGLKAIENPGTWVNV